jgi:hypothetical protein
MSRLIQIPYREIDRQIVAIVSDSFLRLWGNTRGGMKLSKTLSKNKLVATTNSDVDYNKVMKSGYMEKKKMGAKKWEYR